LEETLANKTINRLNQPHGGSASGKKKVQQPSEPKPKPTPSLATTHTKQNESKQANRWDRG
jgi:ribosomal protein L2